ncbi:MAG: dihydroorotate dehydrogenase electron transfer subunit [Actinomycetota bacterium]
MTGIAPAAEIARASVRSLHSAGPYALLALDAPDLANAAKPGQFVSLAQRAPGHLLRRPFSVLDAHEGIVEIGFDVIGAGTQWLNELQAGETIDISGPFGVAYTPPVAGTVLLVGGGYGAAPLLFLASQLKRGGSQVKTHVILGAAFQSRLFEPDRAERNATAVTFTTEDGSRGLRGRVTDAMKLVPDSSAVYACGPMAMLAAVTRATPTEIPVEVAVEEFMGCGIGVCWTCVVPTHNGGYRRHVRSCIEGPVFDGRSIQWL